eukprot:6210007-Pleurochrysis_carterae.AAC.1
MLHAPSMLRRSPGDGIDPVGCQGLLCADLRGGFSSHSSLRRVSSPPSQESGGWVVSGAACSLLLDALAGRQYYV